ncbi:MAG: histidine phosphatase family protein [Candidatus Eremiobacteraeota bacterium]|nr:histidine phosphatase family protein [Candidatus Eremiobacteraeota bacterium]MBV8353975.1 histidine phosphatase family protein [Candidatus Eremiobacteraeota bacterium]
MIALVTRHGETTWNVAGRYQGRRESELSDLGKRQAAALADALAEFRPRIERIVSSPLVRCTATAQSVADRLDVAVETDPRLIEIGHGDWEGRLREEIMRDDPRGWYLWKNEPTKIVFSEGDSVQAVAERWRSFAGEPLLVPTLIVTHDATARLAVITAEGRSIDEMWTVPMENAAYVRFDVSPGGKWKVVEPLVNAHLGTLRADPATQAL